MRVRRNQTDNWRTASVEDALRTVTSHIAALQARGGLIDRVEVRSYPFRAMDGSIRVVGGVDVLVESSFDDGAVMDPKYWHCVACGAPNPWEATVCAGCRTVRPEAVR